MEAWGQAQAPGLAAGAFGLCLTICIPYAQTALVDHFHRHGRITSMEYGEDGVTLTGLIPRRDVQRVEAFRVSA